MTVLAEVNILTTGTCVPPPVRLMKEWNPKNWSSPRCFKDEKGHWGPMPVTWGLVSREDISHSPDNLSEHLVGENGTQDKNLTRTV